MRAEMRACPRSQLRPVSPAGHGAGAAVLRSRANMAGDEREQIDELRARSAIRPTSLRELAWRFGRLGFTAFGGPAAHTAMMEDEVVRRRRWMTHEQFLDLLGATNLIPGPNSTEMAIHIGHARARWAGLVVAGVCFISPAVFIVMAIAWGYVRFGALPEVAGVLYGVKPVIIAVGPRSARSS